MAEENATENSIYADAAENEDVPCLDEISSHESFCSSGRIPVTNHSKILPVTCASSTAKSKDNCSRPSNDADSNENKWGIKQIESSTSEVHYKPNFKVTRYATSLKHFIPIREKIDKCGEVMPLDHAGFFSFITYGWLTPYMKHSYKHGLQAENVPQCSTSDACDLSAKRIEHMWKEEVHQKGLLKASLKNVAWKFIRTRVLLDMFLYLISLTLGFLGPIVFMRRLLEFCEDKDAIWWHGALWALGMAGSELIRVTFFAMTWGVAYRTGVRLRSALIAMLYKKIMRLPTLGNKSIGELINIFANDGQRIYDFAVLGPMIIGGPFIAVIGTGYILWLLGPSSIFGMLTFILFYPIQYVISSMAARVTRKRVRITDQRIRLMNELLTCVKLIKMYAWEKPFFQTVREIREDEQGRLELAAFIQSISSALAPVVPIVAVIITFLAYISSGNDLSPAEAFTVWCIMDIISIPGYIIPTAVSSTVEMRFTLDRIKSILCMEEMKLNYNKPMDHNIALAISNATFFWHCSTETNKKQYLDFSKSENNRSHGEASPLFVAQPVACLVDISILVPKGRLVGVCGTVAAGKSSFLSAILGQLKLDKGKISVDGSFAYVSQQAWIMNCSLKDNILFGESFDAKKYYSVIHACALGPDVAELPAGDETEIGERGVNLSGGQRQRVAIARALYADKDIYLLDDPLSAVDSHVAQHIFENCICGALLKKTCVFVTHQLQFLSRCDEVVFMEGGHIVDQGPHTVLVDQNEKYFTLINTFLNEERSNTISEIPKENDRKSPTITSNKGSLGNIDKRSSIILEGDSSDSDVDLKLGHLIQDETVEVGSVPINTYLVYIKYAGGYGVALLVLIFFIINVGSTAMSSWWLAHWLNSGVLNTTKIVGNETEIITKSLRAHPDSEYYETVYGIFILVILLSCVCRSFVFIKASLRASSQFHHRLFVKVFASPMRFFDSTPVGRLLNAFSRDMEETDCRLPTSMEAFIQNSLFIVASIVLIVLVFPWFLVALVLFAAIFLFFSRLFRCAIRDLKRLENISRSPIYSHVAATVNGLNTIHAFGKEREFISKFMHLFDENTSRFFLFNCSIRWLAIRLDVLSCGIVGITASLVVIFHGYIPAAFAGLALAYAGQFSGMLRYSVQLATETESRFMSVQRMHTYLQTLESENFTATGNRRPPSNWPHMGAIRFCNVKMRYQNHLPLVIKGISFDIEPQEKIGIVGRTGSGKSSLGGCLFRLVELTSGAVKIDGIDIAEIDLEDLRSKLSIIPQDPVLFIGTVRYNVDPFKKYTDEAIWNALERTKMKNKIKSLNGQLEGLVIENGENFSVGERQLICMARALLRRSKVLVLDEATAAIDTQTDSILQSTLRDAFKDCTVLTIAHRLNTVLNCDRILVLEDGKVVEFDQPTILLSNEKSYFFKMMSVTEGKNSKS